MQSIFLSFVYDLNIIQKGEIIINMSSEKGLKEENDRLSDQLRKLQEQRENEQHEFRKAMLEAKAKLDFQTRRADDYEQKYKSTLQYKNQQDEINELDRKLREKEDQVIAYMQSDEHKAQQINGLLEEIQQIKITNSNLQNQLSQIKEVAFDTITDKNNIIDDLNKRLQQFQDIESSNNLREVIGSLEQKYRQLQQQNQKSKLEYEALIKDKEEEIEELQEKITQLKDKHDDRVTRLEQDIIDYERHIEEMAANKDHQDNLEEKYYLAEERLRKTEKKLLELEQTATAQKAELVQSIQKLQTENETARTITEQWKEGKLRVKQLEKQNTLRRKQAQEAREKLQKSNLDWSRRINYLESEKKIISDNLAIKQQEIEKLKAELEQQLKQAPVPEKVPMEKKRSYSVMSPQKQREDDMLLVQKIKKHNKDLQEANQNLKKKLEEQTKELQEARQKLLQARASQNTNSELNKLKLQIEDLTSYLKKVQNEMLMKKIAHAEDENFWSQNVKKYKKQIEDLNIKYKKQNSELLQRIDRMKKLVPKDKKTDYYQSGFK